jgi:hypothetical protein
MAVSMAEMERVILGGGEDIGNVIELGDLNDDLGMSLLANPSKITVNQPSSEGRSVSFAPSAPSKAPETGFFGGDMGGIELTPLEPMEPISLGGDMGPTIDVNSFGSTSAPAMSFTRESSSPYGNSQTATGPGIQFTSGALDPVEEKKEKTEYLNKLQRLEQKGFPVSKRYTMDNSLQEIKDEYFRLVDARNLEISIKFQRQMLMGAITGLEWLNGKYDPFDIKLEGWSEATHEKVEDYDEIFEELYDKYKDKGKTSPEFRLIMAVVGSGFATHISNTFFRSKMPSMDEILRNNPQLQRQMAAAAAAQSSPAFGQFMSAAMGVPQQGMGGGMGPGMGGMGVPVYPGNGGPPMSDAGAFMGASGAVPVRPMGPMAAEAPATARREMKGPTGVDDILKTFEEVRRAEAATAGMPAMATGVATQPAVAGAMQAERQSVISADEYMSTATGATGTGGRRKRKQAAPPTGTTFSLNV